MASPHLRILIASCCLVLCIPAALSMGIDAATLEEKSSPPSLNSPIVDAPVYSLNEVQENTWSGTFKRALQGPTGQMVVHIAKEVIARQVGGTQVLSLNLTNLLILLFLKAIIFAAGLIGAGSWGQYGRSLDNGETTKKNSSEAKYVFTRAFFNDSNSTTFCLVYFLDNTYYDSPLLILVLLFGVVL